MQHHDEEEIKPSRASHRSGSSSDRMLTVAGIVLAGASALFPWYVFFNEDKFGIRVETMDHTRDLPDMPARNVFSVSPLAMVDNTPSDKPKEPLAPLDPIDELTTATVASTAKAENGDSSGIMQPLPGKNSFRLMHVANGRALIEDSKGMYMVRVGSILPDNSRLATIEQRGGRWVIITSTGEVLNDQASAGP